MTTTYESYESAGAKERRLLRQEELILEMTEALCGALDREGITRTELARRLGKTKGYVSQLLSGGRNLTLRTIADVTGALGFVMRARLEREGRSAAGFDRVRRLGRGEWRSNLPIRHKGGRVIQVRNWPSEGRAA